MRRGGYSGKVGLRKDESQLSSVMQRRGGCDEVGNDDRGCRVRRKPGVYLVTIDGTWLVPVEAF